MRVFITTMVVLAGVVAATLLISGPAPSAQDPSLPPSYGTVNLKAGFMPDPHVKPVIAGGPIHTTLGGVSAYVAKRPDYRVIYTPGKAPLTFFVESDADTTLLINLPNGTWVANDDFAGGRNPMIHFARPMPGQYDIWVGTFGKKNAPAVLHITERRLLGPI